jgi:hypothetical protein
MGTVMCSVFHCEGLRSFGACTGISRAFYRCEVWASRFLDFGDVFCEGIQGFAGRAACCFVGTFLSVTSVMLSSAGVLETVLDFIGLEISKGILQRGLRS